MAADGEVNVKVKVTAENGGVTKVENGLDKIEKKAKQTTESTRAGFSKTEAAIGKVTKATEMFNKVIAGLGVIGVITGIASGIKKISDSFKAAKKEAEEFEAAAKAEAAKKQIDDLAASYNNLTKSIQNANLARAHENELEDIRLKQQQDLEDAQIDLAEQQELAAVDANAFDASERRAEISARYQEKRTTIARTRGEFAIVKQRERLGQEADEKRKTAERIEASTSQDDAAIKAAKERLQEYRQKSWAMNDADNDDGYMNQAYDSVGKVFSLNWGRLGDYRTSEGNAIREKAKQNAQAEEERIKALEAERQRKLEEAKSLREEAKRTDEKREALGGGYEVNDVRGKVNALRAQQVTQGAEAAHDKKIEEEDAKNAMTADAVAAVEQLALAKRTTKQQIAAEQARKDEAARTVQAAADDLELAKLNKSGTVQATQNYQAAQRAADGVNREADAAIATLTETLKDVEARLKAAQNHLKSESKKNQYAWSESPAGA